MADFRVSFESQRVYFLAGAGLIKIGYSAEHKKRIRTLRNSSPVPLEVLGVFKGDRLMEMLLHVRFASKRRHGEWFEDCPELREMIESIRTGNFDLRPGLEVVSRDWAGA